MKCWELFFPSPLVILTLSGTNFWRATGSEKVKDEMEVVLRTGESITVSAVFDELLERAPPENKNEMKIIFSTTDRPE